MYQIVIGFGTDGQPLITNHFTVPFIYGFILNFLASRLE